MMRQQVVEAADRELAGQDGEQRPRRAGAAQYRIEQHRQGERADQPHRVGPPEVSPASQLLPATTR